MMLPILVAVIALVLVLCQVISPEVAMTLTSFVGFQTLIDDPLAESLNR